MQIKKQTSPTIPFYLFIFILVFAPLAFGSVELWSIAIVELSIAILGLTVIWYRIKGNMQLVRVPGIVPLICLIVWMVIQIIPLPPQLVQLISPGSFAAYEPVFDAMGENQWLSLSVNQKFSCLEIIRISSYALLYILTAQVLSNSQRLQTTVKVVVGLTVVIAFIAILQRYTSPDQIYWFREGPVKARIMGPWINRSQFAGFIAMIFPIMLGYFLYFKPSINEKHSMREKIVILFSSPGSNAQLLLGFGLLISLFSVFLSLSRGGIINVAAITLLFYFLLTRKRGRRLWPILLIFCGGIFLFYLNFGMEQIVQRIDDSFTAEGNLKFDRIATWTDTFAIIKTFWLTGSGFGTFVDVFPLYKTIPNNFIYDHAHNDYLELLSNGGVIGFLLAGWFVVSILFSGWSVLKKRRDQFAILLGIGAMAGIFSMLLYGITDFNMHNGADGLYFFFLCGLLVSCANTRFHYRSSSTLLTGMPVHSSKILLAASCVLLVAVLLFPARIFIARQIYKDVEGVYFSRQLSKDKLKQLAVMVEKSSSLDPLEGTYLMVLGNIEKYLTNNKQALEFYLAAACKSPLRGEFLQKVALMLPKDNELLANELMELSYKRSLKKDQMMLNFAEWLIWRGEKQRAAELLKDGFAGNPTLLEGAVLLLEANYSAEIIAEILPMRVEDWIKYGELLENNGQVNESEYFRKKALDFIENEEVVRANWFSQLYYYYVRQKKEDAALDVLRQAVLKMPEVVEFHLLLGDYYKKEGIIYRAREEYEQALIFEPGNEVVKKRLDSLSQ